VLRVLLVSDCELTSLVPVDELVVFVFVGVPAPPATPLKPRLASSGARIDKFPPNPPPTLTPGRLSPGSEGNMFSPL
jgi:hypothetical protein